MARDPGLDVWLYGCRVARLSEPSTYRYRLAFTDECFDVFGVGSRVLSLALPASRGPVTDSPRGAGPQPVAAFLEGLLPEGQLRQHVARVEKTVTIDKIGLLRAVGQECAGAVQFTEIGVAPASGAVRPLSGDEVNTLIADLPSYHLPDGTRPQASLAGLQDKVLLTDLGDGQWGWPEGGAASSHLIKPQPVGQALVVPHLIQTEHWALRVAAEAGLGAAQTRLQTFDTRPAIVVTRYDRTAAGQRIHQEDFCQALGLDPNAKYESTAEYAALGSRLSQLALLASPRAADPSAFRADLLAAVAFNTVIGNGDAHSKNYSLLIAETGEVSLAPLYDVAPVMYLNDQFRSAGHILNGKTNLTEITISDLVEEATAWGMRSLEARRVLSDTMERIRAAFDTVGAPDGALEVLKQLNAVWETRSWPGSAAASAREHATAEPSAIVDEIAAQEPRADELSVQHPSLSSTNNTPRPS